MEVVFIHDSFELLYVACAVVTVRVAHGLVDALFFGSESIADILERGLRDGGVEMADLAIGILSDLNAFVTELDAQGIDSFFKFVHFWKTFKMKLNNIVSYKEQRKEFRSPLSSTLLSSGRINAPHGTELYMIQQGIKNARYYMSADFHPLKRYVEDTANLRQVFHTCKRIKNIFPAKQSDKA